MGRTGGPTCPSAVDPVSFTGAHKDSAGRRRTGRVQRKRGGGKVRFEEDEEEGKVAKKADDGAGRDRAEQQQQQAHLRQTNKPDPAGSLLSTTLLTLDFVKPSQDTKNPTLKAGHRGPQQVQ